MGGAMGKAMGGEMREEIGQGIEMGVSTPYIKTHSRAMLNPDSVARYHFPQPLVRRVTQPQATWYYIRHYIRERMDKVHVSDIMAPIALDRVPPSCRSRRAGRVDGGVEP